MSRTEKDQIELAGRMMKRGVAALGELTTFSKRTKFEDAVAAFALAANCYVSTGKWRLAAEAFGACADAEIKLENLHAAAAFFVDAAQCYKKIDPDDAMNFFNYAIKAYCEVGRFVAAARLQWMMAEMLEDDAAYEEAADAYQLAADYYAGEAMYTQAIRCLVMSARYLAEAKRFDEAVDRFELAGQMSLNDNLLKFNAPQFFLNGVLCWVATGDLAAAKEQLDQSTERDMSFPSTREGLFARDVIESANDYHIHDFMDHCWNMDNVSPFSPTQLMLLEMISEMILDEPEPGSDDEEGRPTYAEQRERAYAERSAAGDDLATSYEGSEVSRTSGGSSRRSQSRTTRTRPSRTSKGDATSVGSATELGSATVTTRTRTRTKAGATTRGATTKGASTAGASSVGGASTAASSDR
uniref:Uncharacterized protein n=1 Tax=Bicosoecida sp. CB-2014 TaxID=1486930 RepID=A0A7S1C6F0_9STRA|mmetsp:Transcript_15461/g.53710  ORF Transcript_15461/g.53710 Transcript_15461/m.53710 type:complete len:412 (+) Transcript_15461:261-1496(+)